MIKQTILSLTKAKRFSAFQDQPFCSENTATDINIVYASICTYDTLEIIVQHFIYTVLKKITICRRIKDGFSLAGSVNL